MKEDLWHSEKDKRHYKILVLCPIFDSVTVNGDLNVMTEAYMEIVKSIRA